MTAVCTDIIYNHTLLGFSLYILNRIWVIFAKGKNKNNNSDSVARCCNYTNDDDDDYVIYLFFATTETRSYSEGNKSYTWNSVELK